MTKCGEKGLRSHAIISDAANDNNRAGSERGSISAMRRELFACKHEMRPHASCHIVRDVFGRDNQPRTHQHC